MRRLFGATVLALCATLAAVAPAAQRNLNPPPDPSKVQALIVTGRNVGEHQWRVTTPLLRRHLEDTGRFEVRVTEEFRGAGPDTLAPYDLVVVNYYARNANERWGGRAERALADFVRSGKGLVLYHVSLASFDGWAEYEQMSGGNWRPNNGHHSDPHDFVVDIRDESHPITRGVKAFSVQRDELYANLRWQPQGRYHVLATAWDDHSLYRGEAQQPIPGPGLNQPILWTTSFGGGRVFSIALGHFPEAVQNRGFEVMFPRGAEWAATGAVTLPVPPDMARQ